MSGLDTEELARLRALDVAVIRRETPTFADLAWLVQRIYDLHDEAESLESSETKETQDAEERADKAEARLEETLARVADLEQERDHWKATAMIREAAATFEPERLRFLQRALRASLDSVELALEGELPQAKKTKKTTRKVNNRARHTSKIHK